VIEASTELHRFLDRRARIFQEIMVKLADAFRIPERWDAAVRELAEIIQGTLVLSDLHGRRRMLIEADYVRRVGRSSRRGSFEDTAIPASGTIPFEEAIENLIDRDPRLARSADEVSRLYNTSKTFAMAKSSSLKLTERIQEIMARMSREAKGLDEVAPDILRAAKEESHDFARAYAETVYRTNVNTAYTEGRFLQAEDPVVAEVVPAMEFVSQRLPTSRPNHVAAHGLIAAISDRAIWAMFKPPIGYSCQCSANFTSVYDLKRAGLMRGDNVVRYLPPTFGNAYPDPGFKVGAF
jgi:hypothetical protein